MIDKTRKVAIYYLRVTRALKQSESVIDDDKPVLDKMNNKLSHLR